jgi:uncharacterized protein YjeT (DUF2065 family)
MNLSRPHSPRLVALCLAALYLPYAWLLFIEGLWPWHAPQWTWTQLGITPWTWTPHHWLWLKLWPILPGLAPSLWFNAVLKIGRLADGLEFLLGGLVTVLLLGAACWAAWRGGRWTSATLWGGLLISSGFSWLAYRLYAW